MKKKIEVWLLWEMQIVDMGHDKVQFQNLRVIATTKEKSDIYKAIFEREIKDRKTDSWVSVEMRQLDHMLGQKDMNSYVSRNRQ